MYYIVNNSKYCIHSNECPEEYEYMINEERKWCVSDC